MYNFGVLMRNKKDITSRDLKSAEMNPTLAAALKRKAGADGVLTAADMLLIRKFARLTLTVAKQRNNDITLDVLINNLASNLKKIVPGLRSIILTQMKEYVTER